MSRWMLVGLLLLAAQVSWSANMDRGPVRETRRALDVANPQDENVVLRNGTIALNFTNYGFFGNDGPSQSGSLEDVCGGWAPQFEYPAGSGIQYLFQGALWMGADIEHIGEYEPRVSVGTDGWQNPSINEFHAGEGSENGITLRSNLSDAVDCWGNSIYDPSARANLEATAVYTDTLTDQFFVRDDPADGPHVPLGLEVTQTALLWTSPEFARFVILEFDIRNVGTNYLKNLSLGLYMDADIGDQNEQDHHTDDLSGSIVLDPLLHNYLAWSADADGRPHNDPTGPIVYSAAIGAAALTAEAQYGDLVNSFNWWTSNGNVGLDYGPAWSDDPQWDCIYGTAESDEHKLHVLENRERDYDQAYSQTPPAYTDSLFDCASDQLTHDWCPVEEMFEQLDTRFLLSWYNVGIFDFVQGNGICTYRLNPGEEFTFALALVIGDEFHEEGNPAFNFEGLIESYSRARALFAQDYAFQPPTSPTELHATHAESGALPMTWSAPEIGGHVGYRVFGVSDSGSGDRVEFTTDMISGESFTIPGLMNGDYWQIEVVTYDAAGYQSFPAKKVQRVGAIPQTPILSGETSNGSNTLSWVASGDPTLSHYRIVRRSGEEQVEFDNLSASPFVDDGVSSGHAYSYTLYLENTLGITGLPSNVVTLTPFAPTQSLLVYDETRTPTAVELFRGSVPDSLVRLWYQQILGVINEPHTYVDVVNGDDPLTLEMLAQYQLVIWHSENPRYSTFISPNHYEAREAVLRDYVSIGGKLIRFGRQELWSAGVPNGAQSRDYRLSQFEPLTFDSVWSSYGWQSFPVEEWTTKSIGSSPVASEFPALTWDMDKLNSLRYASVSGLGFLAEVDLFWPRGNTWSLYSVNMTEDDSTGLEGTSCAVLGAGEIFFGFPLYFLPQEQAEQLVAAALHALRVQELSSPEPVEPLPTSIVLRQNYPNPFNPNTVIEFELPNAQTGSLKVYNIRGQQVATLVSGMLAAGVHRVSFDASGLSSGVYFYRLEVGNDITTKKMLLLR